MRNLGARGVTLRAALLLLWASLWLAVTTAVAAGPYTVLAVFAHPDDETTVGPLLAKYAREGHTVYLATITSGQKGVGVSKLAAGDELGAAREGELRCAAKNLGIREPFLLQFQDQGISTPPLIEKVVERVREIFNRTRPDVVITWGPDGLSGHPDHRAASNIATQVFQQRALLRGEPRKLYYVAFPESRFLPAPTRGERSGLPGAEPRTAGIGLRTVSDAFITTEVHCPQTMDAAYAAIQCHKTQWDPERMQQMRQTGLKTLESRVFLRLALSDTGIPQKRESSIFENLK